MGKLELDDDAASLGGGGEVPPPPSVSLSLDEGSILAADAGAKGDGPGLDDAVTPPPSLSLDDRLADDAPAPPPGPPGEAPDDSLPAEFSLTLEDSAATALAGDAEAPAATGTGAPATEAEAAAPACAGPEARPEPPTPETQTPPQKSAGGGGGNGAGGGSPGGMARIGDRLVEMGLISKDQLQVALYEKKRSNKLLGALLVELGFITESALLAVLAQSSGHERFDPGESFVDPELIKSFPREVAQRHRVLPVSMDDKAVRLAMVDIYDVLAMDQARRHLPPGVEIIPLVCAETELIQAIDQYYGYELSIDGILRELETGEHDVSAAALAEGGSYVHPLVRLVNAIIMDAVKVGASDLHFEPEGRFLRLRYRIDGVMTQIRTIHKDHWSAISHRLKIVSGMNIADKLNPQDGRFSINIGSHRVDFRVAALPTVHGENIVLRVLDRARGLMPIKDLGLSENNLTLLLRMIRKPEGIIIVTGPTGSGKTTTLYSVLSHINSLERNIMTLEDPVEYELPLIRQSQVREGSALTFAEGVRALLRQDPDVILIGEVRDRDTAAMALRAAMTGHQVYSTLHTNNAAGAIPRLIDLGLQPGLLAGNIIGIIAQRLARRLCGCKKMEPATEEECELLGVDPKDPPVVGHPVGCPACRHTGYRGRIAVHEVLPMNKELDEMVIANASGNQIVQAARKFGFVPMAEDAVGKIMQGVVSVESVARAVDLSDR